MVNRKKQTVNEDNALPQLNGPRLLTLKKAAEYLGLTVWSLRERIWAGDIPVVRFPGGRKMFVDTLDLEKFIQRNKETYT